MPLQNSSSMDVFQSEFQCWHVPRSNATSLLSPVEEAWVKFPTSETKNWKNWHWNPLKRALCLQTEKRGFKGGEGKQRCVGFSTLTPLTYIRLTRCVDFPLGAVKKQSLTAFTWLIREMEQKETVSTDWDLNSPERSLWSMCLVFGIQPGHPAECMSWGMGPAGPRIHFQTEFSALGPSARSVTWSWTLTRPNCTK